MGGAHHIPLLCGEYWPQHRPSSRSGSWSPAALHRPASPLTWGAMIVAKTAAMVMTMEVTQLKGTGRLQRWPLRLLLAMLSLRPLPCRLSSLPLAIWRSSGMLTLKLQLGTIEQGASISEGTLVAQQLPVLAFAV